MLRSTLSIVALTHKATSRGSDVRWLLMGIFTVAGGSKDSDTGLGYAIIRMGQCIRGHGQMGSGV